MSILTLKFKGIEDELLNNMISSGLFATKSEAIRASIVGYAIQMDLFKRKKLWEEVKKSTKRKTRLSEEDLNKKIEAVKNATPRIH